MLLVIMTRSLIRLGNTVRASLNNDCMTNSHDECQWDDNDDRTDDRTDDNTGITKGYNEWNWEDDAMTETNSGITRDYRGYNAGTRDYDSITRSYRRHNEKL